jgi:hypothetical protein
MAISEYIGEFLLDLKIEPDKRMESFYLEFGFSLLTVVQRIRRLRMLKKQVKMLNHFLI